MAEEEMAHRSFDSCQRCLLAGCLHIKLRSSQLALQARHLHACSTLMSQPLTACL